MKTLILVLMTTMGWPQEHKKEIKISDAIRMDGKQKTIIVDNIFGEIKVSNSSSSSIQYSVVKTIEADSDSDLQEGINEVQLKVINRNDSIILYIDAPFMCSKWNGCQRNGRWFHRDKEDYDFVFDFELKIPQNSNLNVQTVDKGDVIVEGISGTISANNVNGHVLIKSAQLIESACTVNGDVDIYFARNPTSDGRFKTINGTINLYCMDRMNARVKAKTMNGNLYTAFDYEATKPQLTRSTSSRGESTVYKIDESFGIEIGQNGPLLSFETLNGDIYLKRQ
ncbi:hypothetical protein [Marinoscillum sp.]|uniref:hypothetical protein n=1 Tax=Marinoscillum sp. TaxID=2024838 RepID=UPI003BAB021B